VFVYLDDLLLVSATFKRHLEILKEVACQIFGLFYDRFRLSPLFLSQVVAKSLRSANSPKPLYMHCDASKTGVGGVLVKLSPLGDECSIAFVSKKLNQAQQNYSVTERECLAAIVCL